MATDSVVVKAQVDATLKQNADSTLRALGLDMTSAIRMFLSQVVLRDGIPFEVAVPHPNRTTQKAIADSFDGNVESASSVDKLFANAKKARRSKR
jgi:DNA-damage-inducible protein J